MIFNSQDVSELMFSENNSVNVACPKVVYSQHTPVQFLYFGVRGFVGMFELCSILIWIVPKRRIIAASSYDDNGHYRSTSVEK